MKKSQYIKQRRISQRNLDRIMCKNIIYHIIVILIMMTIALFTMPKQNKVINNTKLVYESEGLDFINNG